MLKKYSKHDEAMAIRLDVTSTMVTTAAMKDALNSGLVKSTGNNTGSYY